MRMWDITFLIICFELAMGFAGGLGLFGYMYYTPSQEATSTANGGLLGGNISATGELISSSQVKNADYFSMSASLVWGGIGLLLNIVASVAFFLPHLVKTFMLPMVLAVPIQALIYICYSWSLAQYLSGRGGGYYQ